MKNFPCGRKKNDVDEYFIKWTKTFICPQIVHILSTTKKANQQKLIGFFVGKICDIMRERIKNRKKEDKK